MKKIADFWILGKVESLKNRRRIVKRAGRVMSIKSKAAMAYSDSFMQQVNIEGVPPLKAGSKERPLFLYCRVDAESHRPDLNIEIIKDLLEDCGVISNDRWIKAEMLVGGIDKVNPKAHIIIYEFEEKEFSYTRNSIKEIIHELSNSNGL